MGMGNIKAGLYSGSKQMKQNWESRTSDGKKLVVIVLCTYIKNLNHLQQWKSQECNFKARLKSLKLHQSMSKLSLVQSDTL